MEDRFFESWFNTEHVVLGRRLHPFCFYDALILSLQESPFMADELRSTEPLLLLPDLRMAVMVCSSEPKIFLEGRFNLQSKRLRLLQRVWRWRTRKLAPQTELEKFQRYLADFNAGPKFWIDQGEGGGLRAPWVLANVTHLLRTTTFTPEQVWRMPIGQALWYSATVAEQTGTTSVEIMTTEEIEACVQMGMKV